MQCHDLSVAKVDHIAILQQSVGFTLENVVFPEIKSFRRRKVTHQLLLHKSQGQRKTALQPILLGRMYAVPVKLPVSTDMIPMCMSTSDKNR